jgi:hypothetical protein
MNLSVRGWLYLIVFLAAYVPLTYMDLVPAWVHIVVAASFVTASLASQYPDELAAARKMWRSHRKKKQGQQRGSLKR